MPMDSSIDLSKFYRRDENDSFSRSRAVATEKFARKVKHKDRHTYYPQLYTQVRV